MGWNCFKSENSEAKGRVPLRERISETLQTRFPRLYKLIKRIKENGAPSKIKLRRKRKINSVVPAPSPTSPGVYKNETPAESGATANGRVSSREGIQTGVTHGQKNVHVRRIQVLPAVNGLPQEESLDLSKETLGSSSDQMQIKSLINTVVNSTFEESDCNSELQGDDDDDDDDDDIGMRISAQTKLDSYDPEGKRVTISKESKTEKGSMESDGRIGSSQQFIGSSTDSVKIKSLVDSVITTTLNESSISMSCSNEETSETTPKEKNQGAMDGLNRSYVDMQQVSRFVGSVIDNAVDSIRESTTQSSEIYGSTASVSRGSGFNETAWEVIDMDDEDKIISVTQESKVVYLNKSASLEDYRDRHDTEIINTEGDSNIEKAGEWETNDELPARSLEAQSAPVVIEKNSHMDDKHKVKSTDGKLVGDICETKDRQVSVETEALGPDRPLSTLTNDSVKSEVYLSTRRQTKVDACSGHPKLEQNFARYDRAQAAGDEDYKTEKGGEGLRGYNDGHGGAGKELRDFMVTVVGDMVDSALLQADAKTRGYSACEEIQNGAANLKLE